MASGTPGRPWTRGSPPSSSRPAARAHAAIGGLLDLRERGLRAGDVEHLAVGVTDIAHANLQYPLPTTALEGKFSMSYCAARTLVEGRLTIDHFSDAAVNDPALSELVRRIDCHHDQGLTDAYVWGDHRPAVLTVRLRSGEVLTHRRDAPPGAPGHLPRATLLDKVRDCVGPRRDPHERRRAGRRGRGAGGARRPARLGRADDGGMTRVAVVMGGGSGIGQAIAVALARTGATVVAAGRHLERVEETGALARDASGGLHAEQVDVTDAATLHALAERVRAAHGPATVLVNSAGEHLSKPAMDVTTEEWDAVQGTQLRGVFFACQAFGRQMAERGYGKIVNLGSTWGTIAGPSRSVYGIAKAGVAHLTTCLAVEWGPLGIRVNAVAPGATLTAAAQRAVRAEPWPPAGDGGAHAPGPAGTARRRRRRGALPGRTGVGLRHRRDAARRRRLAVRDVAHGTSTRSGAPSSQAAMSSTTSAYQRS